MFHQVKTKSKENHYCEGGLDARSLIDRNFDDFTSPFTLSFCFDREDIKHSRLVYRLFKHLEFRQKYWAALRVFNCLGVWISQVDDILLQ